MTLYTCSRSLAACTAVRFREMGYLREETYGHSCILRQLPREVVAVYRLSSEIQVWNLAGASSRRQWESGIVLRKFDAILYTDGLKMDCGIYSKANSSDKNPTYFQIECK